MISASRFMGVLAGGCLLCLSLSNVNPMRSPRINAWAAHAIKTDQSNRNLGIESINGEVRHIEGQNYIVKGRTQRK